MLTAVHPRALSLKAKLYRGLADPSRLAILDALRAGPLTVTEIAAAAALSQPNTSNHLACLHECGLVTRAQQGRYVSYSLADERVAALLTLAEELVADAAHGVYACTRYAGPGED